MHFAESKTIMVNFVLGQNVVYYVEYLCTPGETDKCKNR